MNELLLAADLRRLGHSSDEINRMVRSGQLIPVRRGAYRRASNGSQPDPRTTHRRLIEATVRQCGGGLVVSHMSVAAIHGLPI